MGFYHGTVGFHGDEGHTILSNSFKTWSLNNPILMVTQFFETNPLNSHFMSIFPNQDAVYYIYIYIHVCYPSARCRNVFKLEYQGAKFPQAIGSDGGWTTGVIAPLLLFFTPVLHV